MFIVFDGPDGSGKSTISEALADRLRQKGKNVLRTYEPTDTSVASRAVRQYLSSGGAVDPKVLADYFTKDREEHVASVIRPHLLHGGVVICDRYKYSTLVYQGYQGVDPDYIIQSNTAFPVPDLVFVLLPGSAEVLMNRIAKRGEAKEIFEKKCFLSQAIDLYKKLPVFFPDERFVFLNADLPVDENLTLIETYVG